MRAQKVLLFFCNPKGLRTKRFDRLASDSKPLANFVCLPLIKGQKPVGVTNQNLNRNKFGLGFFLAKKWLLAEPTCIKTSTRPILTTSTFRYFWGTKGYCYFLSFFAYSRTGCKQCRHHRFERRGDDCSHQGG